ncbi:hypothetical protein HanPI659440_Chr08g0305761 [Helianthus annuus]|nr:hypothetical protein HanPI659440_Chr08g0305761 [Helianthus annuus]
MSYRLSFAISILKDQKLMWVFSLICGLAVIWEMLGGIYTCNEYKIELFLKNIFQVKDEVVGYKLYKKGYKFDFRPPKDLADQLVGAMFYVIGYFMGQQGAWGMSQVHPSLVRKINPVDLFNEKEKI